MASWNEGYVVDAPYTTEFFAEISPGWIATTATLLGYRAPDLSRPFRWAELGCGNGLSPSIFAATNPLGEFHGFDFNPDHVASARHLADKANLSNVHFHEMSFGEVAEAEDGRFPKFDFIVAHGIWSWVAPAVRGHMVSIMRRHLAPGGFVYLSYNCLAGWAALMPLQRFLLEWARANPGGSVERARDAIAFARELSKTDAAFFAANPTIAARLERTQGLDPRYLSHEYLNGHWSPATFSEVADTLDEAKLGFVGSATLIENIDAISQPPGALKMLQGVSNPRLRETLRDLSAARSFRRDLYRRGVERLPAGEHRDALDAIVLVGTGRAVEGEIKVPTGTGQFGLHPDLLAQIRGRLEQGPMPFEELRRLPALAVQPLPEALQALAFLMSAGLAHPVPSATPSAAAIAASKALNAAIGGQNARGWAMSTLAAPAIGTGLRVDVPETMTLAERLAGQDGAEAIAERLVFHLARSGRSVVKSGAPITDPDAARAEMVATVSRMLAERGDVWRRLGMLP
jgi:SAM-dependent methyltransferase